MSNSYTTLERLLKEMSNNIPLIKEGDVIETIKTVYPSAETPKNEKNIVIEGTEMTVPKASSKKTKKMLVKEESLLLSIFNETTRGDLLKVISINKNKIYCENLSVKKEIINNTLTIDKIDILRGDYKLIQRGVGKITNLLNA